jgi:hypothetical protein
MNLERLNKIIEQITLHPETWKQKVWHTDCGTAHCIAGWAEVFSLGLNLGLTTDTKYNSNVTAKSIVNIAIEYLEIDDVFSKSQQVLITYPLFSGNNSLNDIIWFRDNYESFKENDDLMYCSFIKQIRECLIENKIKEVDSW